MADQDIQALKREFTESGSPEAGAKLACALMRALDVISVVSGLGSKLQSALADSTYTEKLSSEIAEALAEGITAEQIAEHIDVADVADQIDISDAIDYSEIVSEIDYSDVAVNIDVSDVAGKLDLSDLVGNLDLSEIACEIDVSDIANEIDTDDLFDNDELAASIAANLVGDSEFMASLAGQIVKALAQRMLG